MRILRIGLAAIALFAAYSGLLCIPQPLFSFSVRANSLILHSDRPFAVPAAEHVLKLVEAKLATSPLYSSAQEHDIFICNSRWRQRLFFNKDYGVGGVAPYPVTANVFLRDALIEDDRLISPGGTPVEGDRTLDYFITHEITHQLTGHAIGRCAISNCRSGCARDTRIMSAREALLTTTSRGALFSREFRRWIGRGPACTGASTCWWPKFWIISIGVLCNCCNTRHPRSLLKQPFAKNGPR
jgi:hypothetical protein